MRARLVPSAAVIESSSIPFGATHPLMARISTLR